MFSYLKLPWNQSKNISRDPVESLFARQLGFFISDKTNITKTPLKILEVDPDLTLEVKGLLLPQGWLPQEMAPIPQLSKLQSQESPLFPFLSSTLTSNPSASPQVLLQNNPKSALSPYPTNFNRSVNYRCRCRCRLTGLLQKLPYSSQVSILSPTTISTK